MLLNLLLLSLGLLGGTQAYAVLNLGGAQWRAVCANRSIDIPAKVPDSIYTDLTD